MTGPLLAAEHLTFAYRAGSGRGSTVAVDDVSLAVEAGDLLGIVGESGSGKSTVARCLVRLLHPRAGRVRFRGEDVESLRGRPLRGFRRSVQIVFQDPYSSLNPRMTIEDIVGEGLLVHHPEANREQRKERIVAALQEVGMGSDALARYPKAFSGGQRQRIAIARALVVEPDVLVCDEPVSALDVSVQAQVINLLRQMQVDRGLAIVFIAHDLAVVRALCRKVVVMHNGRVVEQGTRAEIYEHPREAYTRSLLEAVPIPDPPVERARRQAAGVKSQPSAGTVEER